jgi:two-component system OmpR family sensor kinase
MRRFLPSLFAALMPGAVGVIWALLLQAGVFTNLIFVGNYRFDLAALVSRVGLIITILLLGVFAVGWQLDRLAIRERELEQGLQEEANRRFLRRLDHELKNPLTIIRLGVVNLQQSSDLSETQQASLERVGQQVQRLQNLIEDLRWLTELEERRLEQSIVNLGEVLEEAVALVSGLPGKPHRTIDLSLQQAPWPLGMVRGDRDLLIIAFRNLLDNALKYTEPGGQVEVRATDDGSYAVVEVADTGPGIPDEDLPHIFEELYRGQQAKRVEGSGLGLTLVQKIITLQGGEITVRSRQSHGTVMSVRLPLAINLPQPSTSGENPSPA